MEVRENHCANAWESEASGGKKSERVVKRVYERLSCVHEWVLKWVCECVGVSECVGAGVCARGEPVSE